MLYVGFVFVLFLVSCDASSVGICLFPSVDGEPRCFLFSRQERFTCGGRGLYPGLLHQPHQPPRVRHSTGSDAHWVQRSSLALNHGWWQNSGESDILHSFSLWTEVDLLVLDLCAGVTLCLLVCRSSLSPLRRSSASPSARFHRCSTSAPDFLRCTLTWVWWSLLQVNRYKTV